MGKTITKPQGHGYNQMKNIAEISIKYTPKFKMSELPKITCSNDAYNVLSKTWENMSHVESFKVILLNRANKVLGVSKISTGGVAGTVADPKIIFQVALKANASSVILAHNHPSGNRQPSDNDKRLTMKLQTGGKTLDISVLDHLILTDSTYYSFADEGMMGF